MKGEEKGFSVGWLVGWLVVIFFFDNLGGERPGELNYVSMYERLLDMKVERGRKK